MRFKIALISFILCFCLNGCGDKDNNGGKDKTVFDSNESVPDTAVDTEKLDADNSIDNAKVLTAEEQLKEYYARTGKKPLERQMIKNSQYNINKSNSGNIAKDAYPRRKPGRNITNQLRNSFASIEKKDSGLIMDNQKSIPADLNGNPADNAQQIKTDKREPEYSDSEPPDLINIKFNPTQVSSGETVNVIVQATDDLSGVASIFGMVKSPSGLAMLSFNCPSLMDDGTFAGSIKIPDFAESGIWRIQSVNVTDKVNNNKNFGLNNTVVSLAKFEVVKSDSDQTPPQLQSIMLEPDKVDGGSFVNVLVDVIDDKSGVSAVYGVLTSPSKNARISFVCQYDDGLKSYAANVAIPAEAESGVWLVDYLRLEDKAKNSKPYYPKDNQVIFDHAKINVNTKHSDSKSPVLEKVEVYPQSVSYGDTVQVFVSVSDDISGVDNVSIRVNSPNGKAPVSIGCDFDDKKNVYVGRMFIKENSEVGTWQVEDIMVSDKARNSSNYSKYNNTILSGAKFELLGK